VETSNPQFASIHGGSDEKIPLPSQKGKAAAMPERLLGGGEEVKQSSIKRDAEQAAFGHGVRPTNKTEMRSSKRAGESK